MELDFVELQEIIRKRLAELGASPEIELSPSSVELDFLMLKDEGLRQLVAQWRGMGKT